MGTGPIDSAEQFYDRRHPLARMPQAPNYAQITSLKQRTTQTGVDLTSATSRTYLLNMDYMTLLLLLCISAMSSDVYLEWRKRREKSNLIGGGQVWVRSVALPCDSVEVPRPRAILNTYTVENVLREASIEPQKVSGGTPASCSFAPLARPRPLDSGRAILGIPSMVPLIPGRQFSTKSLIPPARGNIFVLLTTPD